MTELEHISSSFLPHFVFPSSPDLVGLPARGAPAVSRHPLYGDGEGLGVGHGQVGGGVRGGALDEQLRPHGHGGDLERRKKMGNIFNFDLLSICIPKNTIFKGKRLKNNEVEKAGK